VEVTLFATADSLTSATLDAVVARGYAEDPGVDVKVWECLHVARVFEAAGRFDVIHNSFDFLPLTYAGLVATPMVTTIHGFTDDAPLPVYQRYNAASHYVAISDADRHPALTYAATIHHGIDTDAFGPVAVPGPELVFLGRIHPAKGTAEAIEVARRCGRPLVIAGIVADRAYFDERVAPHLDGVDVTYLGPVGPSRRRSLLAGAAALLHPISFEEPFGLSVVEAMASGAPVVAFRRGSMPELIDHGVTGFLVDDVDGAVAAVGALASIDRHRVRAEAVARFDVGRMVGEYLALYRRILDLPGPLGPPGR
jgi:glycosyltransferase involved in cell wall biosynthesis